MIDPISISIAGVCISGLGFLWAVVTGSAQMARSALQPNALPGLVQHHCVEHLAEFTQIREIVAVSEPLATESEKRRDEITSARTRIWLLALLLCSAATVFDWMGAGPPYVRALLNIYSVLVLGTVLSLAAQNLVLLWKQPLGISQKLALIWSADGSMERYEREFLDEYREARRTYERIAKLALHAAIVETKKAIVETKQKAQAKSPRK
jgi:hypothetical protein